MQINELTEQLQIEHPILQAPMAGGITTPELVSEVSLAGGLGMLAAGYMSPEKLEEQIKTVKNLTTKPFGVNLFVPESIQVTEEEIQIAQSLLAPIEQQFNVRETDVALPDYDQNVETFLELVQLIKKEQIPVCSFTFGIPSKEVISEMKQAGIFLVGTATTVREAIENEKAGMDAVVAQGSEAGGHRGGYIQSEQGNLIGLMSLIPQMVDHVTIPVIGAGGIMDGRGVMASICLGAAAAQLGTAFLTSKESGAKEVHKEAIRNASEDDTTLTRAFSGKWARGINNTFIEEMKKHEPTLPTFPVQNALTQRIRKAAGAQENKEFMSLWSGQSVRLAKRETAGELVKRIVKQVEEISRK